MATADLKQISLNVPGGLLNEIDDISRGIARPRSHVIVQALRRDLPRLRKLAAQARQQRAILEKEHGEWL